jgi:predicted PolB exonuclease-like 3'-5' exonuclease
MGRPCGPPSGGPPLRAIVSGYQELITGFVNRIAELSPQLVTFNGSGFELPVLRYRAMVHAIPAVDGRSVDAGVANQRTGRIRFWPFV